MNAKPEHVLEAVECGELDRFGNRAALGVVGGGGVSLPELFAEQVARTPDAVALVCGDEVWGYAELDRASSRLAHALLGCGVGAGDRVALLLPRSAQAVIAVIAVLEAGAAYVPIDPGYPDH